MDIDWEIQQLAVAIDYYERAIDTTFYVKEAEEFEKIIHGLNENIKRLEAKRDE